MKRVAGFRTRDGDNIVFRSVTDPALEVSAGRTEMIRPDQLTVIGDVAFEPDRDGQRRAGEWGRVGPLPRSSASWDLVKLGEDVPSKWIGRWLEAEPIGADAELERRDIMAQYLVVHTPKTEDLDATSPPTRLSNLARQHGHETAQPRWIRAWSPDLHDDRMFSLWEAVNAEAILKVIAEFGFLDTMDAHPVNVREWGPADVLEVEPD